MQVRMVLNPAKRMGPLIPSEVVEPEAFFLPASFAQQRLWLIEQLTIDNTLYIIPMVFRLTGCLQRSLLEQSFQALVDRHEALRTTFEVLEGEVFQVIAPEQRLVMTVTELTSGDAADREKVALEQIRQEMQRSLHLNRDVLFQVRLWQLDETHYLLLIRVHHIIFDEWSSGILIRELTNYYTALVEQRSIAPFELPIQYADFACWQRQWLQGTVLNQQLSYWRQQLKDLPLLNLPGGGRSTPHNHAGASQLFELPQPLLDDLEALSQQAETTLFMTLLAAFQTLLHRYTSQTDIVIGTPIANRHHREVEHLIGFFVNSLVIRTNLEGDPTFRDVLARVQAVTLAAYAHQDLPFEKLVEELQPTRCLNQNPLFQVVFALQNAPMSQLSLPGLSLSPIAFETQTTRFDLEFYVWKCADNFRNLWGDGWQQSDGLRGVVIYNTHLFDSETICLLRQHFAALLSSIVANPDQKISSLPLLTTQEQQAQWLQDQIQTVYPNQVCIHHLFEQQVQSQPDALAVQYGSQQFTYAELNRGSNQLAQYLRKLGVSLEVPVGICLDRSVEAIAAMLAVLKAGGTYVPLDPNYPPERLRLLLEEAQIAIVLTQERWADFLPVDSRQVICLDRKWAEIAQESGENLSESGRSDQLAYVMYTSGSTGKPKGVMVPHRAVNRLVCQTNYVQIEPTDRIAQIANLAFDAATFEIWGALLNGACLVGLARDITLAPCEFAAALQSEQISILFLTTALLNQTISHTVDAFCSLRYLLFGGETANPGLIRRLLQQGKPQHLLHVYGPTENTTFSTWYEVETLPETATTVPIGQAVSHTQVYVLDATLNPVPPGITGEVYLAGDGLARGYWKQPQLTSEKFIPHAHLSMLYKTGDQARYRPDGNLEFLGRLDHQVKIRGFRVELGEIQVVLQQHPMVQTSVVILHTVETDVQLVAYVVPKPLEQPDERELRSFLKMRLPHYMIPAAFVLLDTLPLSVNGKVDYRTLPPPLWSTPRNLQTYSAPTTSLEKSLVEVWSQLLGREVGIDDNFFELGGHSLLATQLVARIRDALHVELPLRCLFANPTIATLAKNIEIELSTQPNPTVAAIQSGSTNSLFPLSFAQQRLWFLQQLTPHNPFYNIPLALRLVGTLNDALLQQSFQEIIRRHAVLRTTFTTLAGQPVQVIKPEVQFTIPVIDLRSTAAGDREQMIQELSITEAHLPFNLKTDLPLRVKLLQFQADEFILLLTFHHIAADGWSLGVFIRELTGFYGNMVKGKDPKLPDLPIQYTDFVNWQRDWLTGESFTKQLVYWRSQLRNLPVLPLPCDRLRPAVQTYEGASYPLYLSAELTTALEGLSQTAGVSLFMLLLAAFQVLLYRYSGQEDIVVGSPIANRQRSELEGLIGFFVNTLVLRSDLSGDPTFRQLLERVQQVTLQAYEHQDLPFEKLVEDLEPERDLSQNPLFQVAFALQNAPMQHLELSGLKLEPVPLAVRTTRFDLEVHLWEPNHGLESLWQSQAGLSGFISYSTDLFDRSTIARFAHHFQTLLESIVAQPEAHLSCLPILSLEEQQQLLLDWNSPDLPCGTVTAPAICFHHLFEAQARQYPQEIALVTEPETLTYDDLNQRADRLADVLQQQGVQTDTLVGLCVDRSADFVIGILGILKAGGAYVPLDPAYPRERLQFMLTDTQVSIVLTQTWLQDRLPFTQATILCLDRPLPAQGRESSDRDQSPPGSELEADQASKASPDSLAYVIYTSGSTGSPKGVLLTHRGLVNVVLAQQQVFPFLAASRVLQFSSISFDASVFEIALALGSGGTLLIPPVSAQWPGSELIQFLQEQAITHALLTPAALAVLPEADLPALQVLITGGEACSTAVLDRWAKDRRYFNAYGPTETTIWATVAELAPGANPLLIGRPVAHTQIYILDLKLQPVPIGVMGELYIGGSSLARGYLNRPELTAEQFIWHSFPTMEPLRLYKTGDLARYQADGSIEFLGRSDYQTKIRGFRVELGEIEATLQRHPAIQDAIVLAQAEVTPNARLVAYFSLNRHYFRHADQQVLQKQQIQQWQTLYNQTYQLSQGTDPEFNITGWNSSYTGQSFSVAEMQEWVSGRVQQILALKPQRVLEMGCGTGLLLFQLAPYCQEYWATDFSETALAGLRDQLERRSLSHVKLLHQLATDVAGLEAHRFDVVILNSVVQYFPSQAYLMEVLAGALTKVAPGGVIFIGDIRSFPLLTAFHADVQFAQADATVERIALRQQVEKAQFEESELTIDPAFFQALTTQFPNIAQVQICLSRGRHHNEMTQFRYNVLLHMGQEETSLEFPATMQWYDWQQHSISIQKIQQYLLTHQPPILGLSNIPNRRLTRAIAISEWLLQEELPRTVGQMRDRLPDFMATAIDPEDWWALETQFPYWVEMSWSQAAQTGSYDVILIRNDIPQSFKGALTRPMQKSQQDYTNDPLQSQNARQLIAELRPYLGQYLPDYMVPASFVPLERLPLTPNGKVDRKVLALLTAPSSDSSPAVIPSSQTEVLLTDIWTDLLQLQHVSIQDNFFELGGHSLLATQLVSRLRDTFGVEIPLKSIFQAPTIASLAPLIDTLRQTTTQIQTMGITRVPRSRQRRLQTTRPPEPTLIFAIPQAQTRPAWTPLVPLASGNSNKPPFFCVHPILGVVFPYLELAHCLESDRRFYGLQARGLEPQQSPCHCVEEMAADYVQAIQTLQPQGPYYLGGWSFGGLVAFEMAQQLTQANQEVRLLALIDTPAPMSYHRPSPYRNLKFLLKTALWSMLPFLADYGAIVAQQISLPSFWQKGFSQWQWSTITQLISEESRGQLLDEAAVVALLRIFYANSRATYRYRPQPYPYQIILFNAIHDRSQKEILSGWNQLAQEIQLHSIPGNHLSMLKSPNVQILAQQLMPYLA